MARKLVDQVEHDGVGLISASEQSVFFALSFGKGNEVLSHSLSVIATLGN